MVWAGHRQEFWLLLSQVRFPKEGVALDDAPLAGRLPAADVEAVVVVDRFDQRILVAVHVAWLVRHVRAAGEPALFGRVEEGAGVHQRRAGRPEAHTGVLIQTPRVIADDAF